MRACLLALLLWAWHGAAGAALELSQAMACTKDPQGCTLAPTQLPFNWDRHHPGQAGRAEFVLQFHLDALPPRPQALFLPRIGNGYELRLNGAVLVSSMDWERPNGPDAAKLPLLITVPAELLRFDNELQVSLRADVGRRAGLAAPVLGTPEEVLPRYRDEYRRRVLVSEVGATLSCLIAMLASALWLSQRSRSAQRRDAAYLYGALAMAGWTVFFADLSIEDPLPAWPWWGLLMSAGFAAGICAITLFCQQIAGLASRRSLQLMIVVGAAGVASAALTLWGGLWQPWVLWLGLIVVAYVLYGLYFAWVCLRAPNSEKLLLSFAVLANVGAGLWDWLGVLGAGDLYSSYTLGRVVPMLYGVVLGYILVQRFRHANLRADDLTETMAAQVQAKSAELERNYRRMEKLAREQASAAERTRILRDMHDGVGSHISSAIRQLQSGRGDPEHVIATLRESLDELKLSIDAMNMAHGDVTTLLAGLRYRLEPRFAASDIELRWDVDTLEPLERLDADAMRQLQFIVYEALSNVLQHADARTVSISAHTTDRGVEVSVRDDGGGFAEQQAGGKGLTSMRARATAIGAELSVRSEPAGTAVEIRLPRVLTVDSSVAGIEPAPAPIAAPVDPRGRGPAPLASRAT